MLIGDRADVILTSSPQVRVQLKHLIPARRSKPLFTSLMGVRGERVPVCIERVPGIRQTWCRTYFLAIDSQRGAAIGSGWRVWPYLSPEQLLWTPTGLVRFGNVNVIWTDSFARHHWYSDVPIRFNEFLPANRMYTGGGLETAFRFRIRAVQPHPVRCGSTFIIPEPL